MTITLINSWKACGGWFKQYTHESTTVKTKMRFTVFLPPQSEKYSVPALYFLSGLTCTDENFVQKAFAQKAAAAQGIALIAPDTSPRGASIEGEEESWDFGTGAGFYLSATEPKWANNYQMYDYVTKELPAIVEANFPIKPGYQSICGHSMGGHGALTIAMKNPEKYRSVSAFAPICHPMDVPWGVKAFTGYLGDNREAWKEYDATVLLKEKGPFPFSILVDQGTADKFLADQLRPEALQEAAQVTKQALTLRYQEGYDHSYFFISSFIEDHINFHAPFLSDEEM